MTELGYFILGFIVVFSGGLYFLGFIELFNIYDKDEE